MRKIIPTLFCSFLLILLQNHLAQAATIKGKVVYKGKVPKLREIKMGADPVCLTKHTNAVFPQTITLGPNNEMKNVFFHIVDGLPKKDYPVPTEPAVLDQKGCIYSPPVLGVRVGQPVKILNPDGTLHNVHTLSKINPEFNLAMPKFRTETVKVFDKPEFMFEMKCDVHPWMTAFITVTDNPFFTTSNEAGEYAINDLPAGTYVLEAWHQRLEPQKITVTLAEGETKEVDVTFQRPDGK
ncbi:MAG: carboxypeptidase regulatory-like domain-containing protein [Candidatus Omnitrophica bacterium]|nr:carboxypeptidase regulatory-like domain-containing protein [Candidatus Omnitrophota bacterium]